MGYFTVTCLGNVSPTSTDGIKMLSDSFSVSLHVMLWEDMAEINTFYFVL